MATLGPVLPDVDVWMKAFSRQAPEPLIVHAFSRHVTDRRVLLLGWVRQGLLARVRDERQFARLSWLLGAFPDPLVLARDHERASRLVRQMRGRELTLAPWPALLWAVAERIGGAVWSLDRRWRAFAPHGCPLLETPARG
jgi:hypothetical protein